MSDREHAESPATLPGWPTEAPTITPEMAALAAPPEADLVPAEGFAKYLCLQTCARNQYIKGQVYTLPEGQPASRFRRLDHGS